METEMTDNTGKVTQVIGPVVDIQFEGDLPNILVKNCSIPRMPVYLKTGIIEFKNIEVNLAS